MVEYTKPWLSSEQQVERLGSRGVDVGDRDHAAALLKAIGYYRLTGYRSGTKAAPCRVDHRLDRRLRMLVMDGVERIEAAVRMQHSEA